MNDFIVYPQNTQKKEEFDAALIFKPDIKNVFFYGGLPYQISGLSHFNRFNSNFQISDKYTDVTIQPVMRSDHPDFILSILTLLDREKYFYIVSNVKFTDKSYYCVEGFLVDGMNLIPDKELISNRKIEFDADVSFLIFSPLK